jgi:hypothetical protein
MARCLPRLLAVVGALLAAPAARAADYTIAISPGLDLLSVATAPSGDTVLRINPASGAVSVQTGSGRRVSTAAANAKVTVTCKPHGGGDTDCTTRTVPIRIGAIGAVSGRAKALSLFTIAMGTAGLATPPTGTNPVAFELAPLGDNSPKTFFVGADFPVAGDDSGLPSGAGQNSFYVYVLDQAGLQAAGETGSGAVNAFRPLSITKTGDLNFGRIQLPPSGTSKITLNPATGVRTVSGSGFGYPTPEPTRGAFTASGEGGQLFSLTIPIKVTLTGPGTLVVDLTAAGDTVPRLSGGLGAPGTYSFTLGGSFTINSTTPTGVYTGVVTVSIDYN